MPRMSGMLRQPSQPSRVSGALGMISGLMIAGRLRVRILVEQRDEQAQALVHLRRGQADAVILVHRVDHVVDELLDSGSSSSTCSIGRALRAARDAPCARLSEST